jgi:hypothetical protein
LLIFYGEKLLAFQPNPQLEEYPLPDGSESSFIVLAATVCNKFLNFVTSSCSLSPIVTQGTPFPFPGPSIVNTFIRRTAFSPNTEIFIMRLNKLTHSIFPNNSASERRIPNKSNLHIQIHQIMKHISTAQQNITIRMRIHPPDIRRRVGICQKVLLERENLD